MIVCGMAARTSKKIGIDRCEIEDETPYKVKAGNGQLTTGGGGTQQERTL